MTKAEARARIDELLRMLEQARGNAAGGRAVKLSGIVKERIITIAGEMEKETDPASTAAGATGWKE